MTIKSDMFKNGLMKSVDSLPLRKELIAVKHFIWSDSRDVKVGLALGFTNAGITQVFRQLGGYWVSAEFTQERAELVASVMGEDNVVVLGDQGQIPFEDKQFDSLVVSSTSISFDGISLEVLIKECHRVLDNGGYFVLTLPRRKVFGLVSPRGGARRESLDQSAYAEKEIFALLKSGFDVLGVRHSCRFWVQLVHHFIERSAFEGGSAYSGWWIRLLYGVAQVLDWPLFFIRRYNVTVCGRRKGWRGRQRGLLNDHTAVVSNAMFYDQKRSSNNTFSATRFK